MKVNIIHPEEKSLDVIQSTINQYEPIYRSPHVGNVNNSELNLILGIEGMGGHVQLEMVDTIRGDDRYSNPRVALIGGRAITLASRNYAKSRVVGHCTVDVGGLETLGNLGIKVADGTSVNLKSLHLDTLTQALPDRVMVTPSTKYFSSIGSLAYGLVLAESDRLLGRGLRFVNEEGKIGDGVQYDSSTPIFGATELGEIGVMPPLEAMMAIEMLKKIQDSGGQDLQIVHVAGPDMIRYTRDEAVMGPSVAIASSVLKALGMAQNVSIDYVVPCMKTILESSCFDKILDDNVQSQYDILMPDDQEQDVA